LLRDRLLGIGGSEPTVTDANLVLGRINPSHLLGGGMPIYVAKAQRAIEARIAKPLGLDLIRAAEGIIAVVNANMIRGIRRVSVEKGYDPRDFALIPFGGAGPLHGVDLAQSLNITRAIIPLYPGIASAFGMLAADVRHDYVQTQIAVSDALDLDRVNATYRDMETQAARQLEKEGFQGERIALMRTADVRYQGQSYELSVPVPSGGLTAEAVLSLVADFHRSHERAYGYRRADGKVEFVNLRLVALGKLPPMAIGTRRPGDAGTSRPHTTRKVFFGGRAYDTPVYHREKLVTGRPLAGPAVIEQLDSTTVVPPGYRATVEPWGNIILELQED
jgi:N-methylhydantoinase A